MNDVNCFAEKSFFEMIDLNINDEKYFLNDVINFKVHLIIFLLFRQSLLLRIYNFIRLLCLVDCFFDLH